MERGHFDGKLQVTVIWLEQGHDRFLWWAQDFQMAINVEFFEELNSYSRKVIGF
jgi:hypothetical protein